MISFTHFPSPLFNISLVVSFESELFFPTTNPTVPFDFLNANFNSLQIFIPFLTPVGRQNPFFIPFFINIK